MIDHERGHAAEGEESDLLEWLLVSGEVLRGENVALDQCLQGVHPVKDNHCFTLVEDG